MHSSLSGMSNQQPRPLGGGLMNMFQNLNHSGSPRRCAAGSPARRSTLQCELPKRRKMERADNTLLDAVDGRTQLVGSNRMEILLFPLGTCETFGINVFKVRGLPGPLHHQVAKHADRRRG